MKAIAKSHTRNRERWIGAARHLDRVTFGILTLLTALALVAALPGSNSNRNSRAQALLPIRADVSIAAAHEDDAEGTSRGVHSVAPMTGEKIAFVSTRGGDQDIYTMDADGTNISRLTSDPAADLAPSWSPDGSKIVFMSTRGGTASHIWVTNADGSSPQELTSGTHDLYPSWSPDGAKIAFSKQFTDGSNVAYELCVMNPDGSGLTRLTTDLTNSNYPSWSPDGRQIVFNNNFRDGDAGYEIWVMNSDGSNQHMISNSPIWPDYGDYFPSWSPDGRKIAFESARNPSHAYASIYIMNPDGSGITSLSDASDHQPTWSADSQQIAFARGYPGQIWVMNADGSNQHNIPSSNQDQDPDWQKHPAALVLVQNEQGTPIPGAQVYRNTRGNPYPSTLVGTTNSNGIVGLPEPQQSEYLISRSLVYTGTTSKGSHDGWAYHVYLTDINQQQDGSQVTYQITDTSRLTQTVTISRTNPLIGFNIVASMEYNATPENISQIATGFAGSNTAQGFRQNSGANDYLLDVTDGQMFIEKVRIYEDKQNWNDADYQFFAYYPRADAVVGELTRSSGNVHAQGSGDFGTPWDQTSAYSTLIHEFGHYAIGARDEYYFLHDGDTSFCALSPDPDYQLRASIMNNQRAASEFCTQDNHNHRTYQNLVNGESVWQTLKRNWNDTTGPNRWSIQSPVDRGFVDRGPLFFISHEANETDVAQVPVLNTSCAPIPVTVTRNGVPVAGASLSLTHNGYSINEGVTDTNGRAFIYGAEAARDRVEARGSGVPGLLYTGNVDITSCDAITIPLSIFLSDADQPDTQWPTHWLTATASFSQNQVHAVLHFTADPPSQPTLYGSQGGTNRQQITLVYDPTGHNYTGNYPLNPNISLDFQFEVGLPGAQGVELFPYTFNAAQFHASGPYAPGNSAGDKQPPTSPTPAPPIWDLFAPENMVSVSVSSTSFISGTGVIVGQVDMPDAINGLVAVGGPYIIQGENPINGSVYVSLEYQSEYFCGLQAGSIAIYRYNGTGWTALTTLLTEEWHLAAADITQWGIYGVFAQPNTQVVFSDVPPGSTFYDYINWITCHGIASGYPDGTFRPSNYTTRGQISKMIASAYGWHLDPPSNGYTFADAQPGSTFFLYIEAAYREGVVSGYPCGGAGEPCDPQQRPYFRPGNNVTRGQIAKIISNGSKFSDVASGQTFQDVAPGTTFYEFVERMALRGIIGGYPCGGPGEPCGAGNKPYFRPGNNASRGQLSKMIYLALQPR